MSKFLLLLFVVNVSFGSIESIDSECRIQAKETAINTYQSCVKESRSQKIEEIRKEYQSKLQDLKSYYDSEMKKLSPSSQKVETDKSADRPIEVSLKKKSKGAAKANSLPAKKTIGKSLPVRNMESVEVPETPNDSDSEIVNIDNEPAI